MWYQFSSEASHIIAGAVRQYRDSMMACINAKELPFPWDVDSAIREVVLCDRIVSYISDVNSRFFPAGREREEGV